MLVLFQFSLLTLLAGLWSPVAGNPVPAEDSGLPTSVEANNTQPELQVDHFYYDIPFEALAIEGQVDGPTAAEMDVIVFPALMKCATDYADVRKGAAVPRTGWSIKQGDIKLEVEPEERAIYEPLDWGQLYQCLVALEGQMYRLQYKESNISIYQIKNIKGKTVKVDIGQIFFTVLESNEQGDCAVPEIPTFGTS